jgi:hypothetical protein
MARTKKPDDNNLVVTTVGSAVPSPENVVVRNDPPAPSPSTSSLVGKEISINLKEESYFGVGPIWLTPENYWCVVPDNLSAADYNVIGNAIRSGKIVVGKTFIPPVDKVSNTLEKYWLMIERNGFDHKNTKSEFSMLIRRGSDSGWTALEVVNYCIEKETKGRRRKEIIRLLEQVAKNYDGPLSLYDPPETAQGIKKVTISPDGSVKITKNSGEEVAKSVAEPNPPENFVRGSKSAGEAINDLFT